MTRAEQDLTPHERAQATKLLEAGQDFAEAQNLNPKHFRAIRVNLERHPIVSLVLTNARAHVAGSKDPIGNNALVTTGFLLGVKALAHAFESARKAIAKPTDDCSESDCSEYAAALVTLELFKECHDVGILDNNPADPKDNSGRS
jgi:hypothetical protein